MDRAALLTSKPHVVAVEFEGTTYHVKKMSGIDRDSYDGETYENEKAGRGVMHNFRARLLVRAICDEAGNRLLRNDDAESFGNQDADLITALHDVAGPLNGIGGKAAAEAKKN